MTRTASQIRQEFIDFFRERHGHVFVPSSPVVPHDDPTLLFTNAGMNQFKEIFLGHSDGPAPYVRAVNSQKCIRAGGKHNDLEDVGTDTYHHTFFEMLGNWSFGDYFKAEAIEWAWDLLTRVWSLDESRLFVTVFAGDESDGLEPDTEAEQIWGRFTTPNRISRWGKKDNFWEMGETGPCGPCSEIHYDSRSDEERAAVPGADLVNRDHPDVVEIWNLVFIQFSRAPGRDGAPGTLTPLPARHVDTGMGLERLVRVLQGKRSNYDTDLWALIFRAIESLTNVAAYAGTDSAADVAYRVVADHVRCLTVALSDGAMPGNEGRGYVLRRILRRAVRHAHQTLGVDGPLLSDLVPAVVDTLRGSFPELRDSAEKVAAIIRDEENGFLRTLDRGIALFEAAADRVAGSGARQIQAADAFKLHDTFGFPVDLTRVMAEERGLTVDEAGYEKLMAHARDVSRKGDGPDQGITLLPDAIAALEQLHVKRTRDIDKYHGRPVSATVKALWNGRDFDDVAHVGTSTAVILDRTNHYSEAGGQIGDRGSIAADVASAGTSPGRGFQSTSGRGESRFAVDETRAFAGYVLHVGRVVEGRLAVGDEVLVTVDLRTRRPVAANHTSTHLLNHALREVLGEEIEQRGSLVAHDRLRFDFTSTRAMSDDEVERTERLVNEAIDAAMPVHADVVALEEAKMIHGLRAVFGEKYPDPVRVVSIGPSVEELLADPANPRWYGHSIELCGGTHLVSTDDATRFVITHEQALAAGVRRITALTGPAAQAAEIAAGAFEERLDEAAAADDEALSGIFDELAGQLDGLGLGQSARHRLAPRLEALRDRVKTIRRTAHGSARREVVDQARVIAERSAGEVIVESILGADKETLLSAMDVIRSKRPDAATLLLSPDADAGKVSIAATVPAPLIGRGLRAGDWVKEAARVCGGGGGGRPDMAQAGGKDPAKADDAADAARTFARNALT